MSSVGLSPLIEAAVIENMEKYNELSSVGFSTLLMTAVIENMGIFRVWITAAEEQF